MGRAEEAGCRVSVGIGLGILRGHVTSYVRIDPHA